MSMMHAAPGPAVTGDAGAKKTQKPALAGHRIKQRKGQKFTAADPEGFRNNLCDILDESEGDMEKAQKMIDSTDQLDFHRYANVFFECILYGGIVGNPSEDADWDMSVYHQPMEEVKGFVDFIEKICRRRPYLKPSYSTTVTKLMIHLLTDTVEERAEDNKVMYGKIAKMTGLLVARQIVPATSFNAALNDRLVEPGISLKYLCDAFIAFLTESSAHELQVALKQNNVDERLMEFLPRSQRNPASFGDAFAAANLDEVMKPYRMRLYDEMTSEVSSQLHEILNDAQPIQEAIEYMNQQKKDRNMGEKDVLSIIWDCVFDGVEGNSSVKPDPAIKTLKNACALFAFFCKSNRSEAELMRIIQNFCIDASWKAYFMKFCKTLYDGDVLNEDTILAWKKMETKHNAGSEFLTLMEPFTNWLEEADSEDD